MLYFDEYIIFDTIQAAGADLDMSRGFMTVNGLGHVIPVNWVKGVSVETYQLGVASDKTTDLSGLTYTAGNTYYVILSQPESQWEAKYYYWYDGTPTAAGFVDALVAAINADETSPVTATDATASIQLVMDAGEGGDVTMTVYVNDSDATPSPTVNTAYVRPQGTPAQVREQVNDSTAGSDTGTYSRWIIDYIEPVSATEKSVDNWVKKTIVIYADEAAANFAGFDLSDYLDGSKTGKTYNGAERFILDGVPQ
jgi:hypothetical protein